MYSGPVCKPTPSVDTALRQIKMHGQAQPDPQLDVEGRISPFMVGSRDWL